MFDTNPSFVVAQTGSYVPLAPLPGTGITTNSPNTDLSHYVKGMFALLIGIAAALAVIMIMIGGIQYMSTDAISGKSEGKDKITQALYGLLLAIVCYLILYTINPNILNFEILRSVTTTPSTEPPPPDWVEGKINKISKCFTSSTSPFTEKTLWTYPYLTGTNVSSGLSFSEVNKNCEEDVPKIGLHDPPTPPCILETIRCENVPPL